MDYLWTPWRYTYVTNVDRQQRQGIPEELSAWPGDTGCVFCNMIAATDYAIQQGMDRAAAERASGIVLRAQHNYICVNRYPYTSGHLMVVPYDHQSALGALAGGAAREMMDLAQGVERVLAGLYRPDGFNIGFNLGKAAGAGVAGHLHLHALPRWIGDTNFLTTIGESRLLPEELGTTWERVRSALATSGMNPAKKD
ncbi:MAG: HIT domain-containing protein [Acidobacteriaceae bacterium]